MSARPPKPPRDDVTPVEGVPIEPLSTIAHRTRTTATDARATLDHVSSLREDMKEAEHRNKLEHKHTTDKIGGLEKTVESVGERVGTLEATVGNLRVDAARVETKLDLIREDTQAMKEVALLQAKSTIETTAAKQKADIRDTSEYKKARNRILLAVAGVITALGAALATYLAAR